MARLFLLLFLMSEWTYTLWSAPYVDIPATPAFSAGQDVLPLAFHYKKLLLEKSEMAPLGWTATRVADLSSETPGACPHPWEGGLIALYSADPLYAFMSLQL